VNLPKSHAEYPTNASWNVSLAYRKGKDTESEEAQTENYNTDRLAKNQGIIFKERHHLQRESRFSELPSKWRNAGDRPAVGNNQRRASPCIGHARR
jgi:hypothetical protein